jgi:DNA-binding CsgD family transcriptional regulator
MSAPAPSPSAFVGRDRELAILRERLTAAADGHGSLVLIGGEAGSGKTALAEVLCREAEERGMLVLVGRCFDLIETPPYGPWLDLFDKYRPRDASPPPPAAFAQHGVGRVASQSTLFHEVREFLTAFAARRPLLLYLDDLHWSDPASLDLLRYLARNVSEAPILLIAAYRTEEVAREHLLYTLLPILARESSAVRRDLRPLREEDVRRLLVARYHLQADDLTRLGTYLHARAEGNALFLGELLRTLEADAILRATGTDWAVGDLAQAPVPRLLRQVIDARLLRLGGDTGRILAMGAVIGQEISYVLWAAVAETDEATLLTAIERGVTATLVEELPDGTGARFVHALIREAVYEGIRPSLRRALHRRVAEALLAQRRSPDPDAVAYHLQRAGDDRAVAWLVQAGERAQRAYAWVTAAERYTAALARVAESQADERERGWLLYRLGSVDRFDDAHAAAYFREANEIATRIGDAVLFAISLFWHGYHTNPQIRRGLAEMERSIALLTALSPADRARIVAHDSVEAFDEDSIWGRYYARLVGTGRYAESREWAERFCPEGLGNTTAGSPRPSFGQGYRGLGTLFGALGRPDEARRAFTLAREALEARGDYIEAGVAAMWELTDVLLTYQTDDLIGRQRLAETMAALWSRAIDSHPDLPVARAYLLLMPVDGRWSEARAVAQAMFAAGGFIRPYGFLRIPIIAVAREQGDLPLATMLIAETFPAGLATDHENVMSFRGNLITQSLAAAVAIDAGDLPTARAWLEMHDRWLTWSGSVFGQADGALGWAHYHRAAGDLDLAHRRATEALVHATGPRQPLTLLAAHRLLGELDTDAWRFDAASTHLDAALQLAHACAAPYERALTLLSLATLHTATADHQAAGQSLAEARAICVPLGAQPALARADALAALLAPRGETVYPAGLSAREVEVLRLVAAGRTNREIAVALSIAEKTVERHITHILTKANLANRAAAASFATHHGLI